MTFSRELCWLCQYVFVVIALLHSPFSSSSTFGVREMIKNADEDVVKRILTPGMCKILNKSAKNIGQTIQHFFDLIKLGIYCDFEDWANDHLGENGKGSEKQFIFVHVVVFIWPFLCASSIARNYERKYGLHTFFRGDAANMFRKIVELLGFDESTYPYISKYENDNDKNKVLRIWEGPRHPAEEKNGDDE